MSDKEVIKEVIKSIDTYIGDGPPGQATLVMWRDALECIDAPAWDASQIKPPNWAHVEAAYIEGARGARENPDATEADFRRAADGHTKRVFEEVDPVSEEALRTESWATEAQECPYVCDSSECPNKRCRQSMACVAETRKP